MEIKKINFAELIKGKRKHLGYTRLKVEKCTGISKHVILNIENGKTNIVDDEFNVIKSKYSRLITFLCIDFEFNFYDEIYYQLSNLIDVKKIYIQSLNFEVFTDKLYSVKAAVLRTSKWEQVVKFNNIEQTGNCKIIIKIEIIDLKIFDNNGNFVNYTIDFYALETELSKKFSKIIVF